MYVSVDGTDFLIREPSPFDPLWCSHKFHHAALRYEIGVSVTTGLIVWVYGPFPAGAYNDQAIFNLRMRECLLDYEKVIADNGYGGPKVVHGEILGDIDQQLKSELRSYYERVNGRIKSFMSLQHCWRHPLEKHSTVLLAVAKLVQICLHVLNKEAKKE